MVSSALTWLVKNDPNSSQEVLRAAWAEASATQDLTAMALVAAQPHVPADLDILIGQVSTAAVRIAHLRRPGLSAERGAELLQGESRYRILAALLADPRPTWAVPHACAGFLANPTWSLAKIMLTFNDLPEPVLQTLTSLLLPHIAVYADGPPNASVAELSGFLSTACTVRAEPSRTALLEALTPLVLRLSIDPTVVAPLLSGPLPDPALRAIGGPVLTMALDFMNDKGARGDQERLWRVLLGPVLTRETLPADLRAQAQALLSHPQTVKLLDGQWGLPGDALVVAPLRTTTDFMELTVAITASATTVDLCDALRNPALTADQVQLALRRLNVTPQCAVWLRDVGPSVRTALLLSHTTWVLRSFGWDWFADPAAAQLAFMADVNAKFTTRSGNAAQPRSYAGVGMRAEWALMSVVEGAHYAAALREATWLQIPAAMLHAISSATEESTSLMTGGRALSRAVGAELSRQLGSDPAAWQMFSGLLGDFTGTVQELLDTVVALGNG